MKKLEGRIITENPLRILGVYSDTPKKEIVANLGKLRAFAKTGKTLSFDSDFTSLLGPVNRTLEAIEKANNDIALAKDRIQSSLFWFNFDFIQNKDVFTSLNSGDVDSAIMTLRYDFTPAALVNSAVCFLIRRKWSNTLFCYAQLFNDNRYESYLNSIIGQGGGISKRDIIDIIICSLYSYYPEVDWLFYSKAKRVHYGEEAVEIGTRLSSSEFVKVLYTKRVDLIRNKIHSIIDEVEKKNLDNPDDCLNAIKEIDFLSCEFDNLEEIIPKKDSRYSFLANKVANLLNSLCFKYFYNSNDYKKAKTVLPYTKRAYLLACSDKVIEICKKGFLYVSSKVDELPPEIIENECKKIHDILATYEKTEDRKLLLPSLLSCKDLLIHIQSVEGLGNTFFLLQSSVVVEFGLNKVIKEVNEKQKIFSDSLRTHSDENIFVNTLLWAKTVIDYLNDFDMNEKCRNRFDSNCTELYSLFRRFCFI